MKCEKCKHFRVIYEPIKHFDSGRAVCDKHNLVKDFMSHRELKRLECADGTEILQGRRTGMRPVVDSIQIDRVLEIIDDADKKAGDKTYIVLDDESFYSQAKYIKEKVLDLKGSE